MHDGEIEYPMGEPTFERPTLLSSCALAATASEARFRVPYPNSQPRVMRVIALDDGAKALVAETASHNWGRAQFYALVPETDGETTPAGDVPVDITLNELGGGPALLSELILHSDGIVMVATSSTASRQGKLIGGLAQAHNVMAVALIVGGQQEQRAVEAVAAALRPAAGVLVISDGGSDYLVDMLCALRA